MSKKTKLIKISTLLMFLSMTTLVVLLESGTISFFDKEPVEIKQSNLDQQAVSLVDTITPKIVIEEKVNAPIAEKVKTQPTKSVTQEIQDDQIYLSSSKFIIPFRESKQQTIKVDDKKTEFHTSSLSIAQPFQMDTLDDCKIIEDTSLFNISGSNKSIRGLSPLEKNKAKKNLLFYYLIRKKRKQ